MIDQQDIIEWSAVAPWPKISQVEQDLLISRALVELFQDSFLQQALRLRGGTALSAVGRPVISTS